MTLKTGTIIADGRYQIARRLGQGQYGITYTALEVATSRVVVLKELFVGVLCQRDDDGVGVKLVSKSLEESFLTLAYRLEAMCLQFKENATEHAVRVTDAFRANGTLYVVEDYVTGESLDNIVKKELPTEEQALSYMQQIACAVGELHERGIYHLDVSPRNVRIDADGRVVLVGFASAKYPRRNDTTNAFSGLKVSAFAPLELENMGVENATAASDIYSLGATLYALLTRRMPPKAQDLLCDGFPERELKRRGVSERTIEALRVAMSPSRLSRPQSVAEFWRKIAESDLAERNLAESGKLKAESNLAESDLAESGKLKAERDLAESDLVESAPSTSSGTKRKVERRDDGLCDTIREMIDEAREMEDTVEKARSLYRKAYTVLTEAAERLGRDDEDVNCWAEMVAEEARRKVVAHLGRLEDEARTSGRREDKMTLAHWREEAKLVELNLTTLPLRNA